MPLPDFVEKKIDGIAHLAETYYLLKIEQQERKMSEYKAVQVELSISFWKGEASDNSVSRKTENMVDAERGTMRVVKGLVPKYLLAPIDAAVQAARRTHMEMTLPGLTRGMGLLSLAIYEKYFEIMGERKDAFSAAVENFIAHYPDVLASAEARLGKAFNKEDFPSIEAIRGRFSFDCRLFPIPSGKDWRIEGIQEEHKAIMREECDAAVKEMYREATAELFNRFKDSIERVLNQLKGADGNVRKNTLANFKEILEVLPKMNISNDPKLFELAKGLQEAIVNMEAEDLKNSVLLKDNLRDRLEAAIKKINTQ